MANGGSSRSRPNGSEQGGGEAPYRMVPDVGERVEDDVLREFTDPAGTLWRGDTPIAAIERFVAARGSELKTSGADLRELDAAEGVGTLRIRYRQFHNDLPVLGATLQAVANLRSEIESFLGKVAA